VTTWLLSLGTHKLSFGLLIVIDMIGKE